MRLLGTRGVMRTGTAVSAMRDFLLILGALAAFIIVMGVSIEIVYWLGYNVFQLPQ